MNYFQPKTFLQFGRLRNNNWRLGSFTIDPVNDQYNHEHYWISSSQNNNGKYTTSYWHDYDSQKVSPEYNSEEEAIAWLETALRALSAKKIIEKNKTLREIIAKNNSFIKTLK